MNKLEWLRKIRLTLIARRVHPSQTVRYELNEAGWRLAQRAKPGVLADHEITPQATLTYELANASRKAQRFLRSRGLLRADREDIIGAALLWCWENRDSYKLTDPIDAWFAGAVRDAFKAWYRHENRHRPVPVFERDGASDTTDVAVVQHGFERWFAQLTPAERDVAQMQIAGLTRQEMMRRGIGERTISNARKRFKQLRGEIDGNL